MKKLSALILTVLVLAAALCGCGGSSDAPDTTGTTPAPAADKTDGKAAVDTATTLKDGSPALLFEDVQPADDYGTKMSCPVYGYSFSHDGVPFIVAYIVVNESAADSAKRTEMKGYVDDMINTVRTAQ